MKLQPSIRMERNHRIYYFCKSKNEPSSKITWIVEEPKDHLSGEKRIEKFIKNEGIDWSGSKKGSLPQPESLIGLEDAFDHTVFGPGDKIAYCIFDQLGYHARTWDFLKAENNGKCCVCGRKDGIRFVLIPGESKTSELSPQDRSPAWIEDVPVITLKEVEQFFNRQVIFKGFVTEVHLTKNGTYFIRFEPREFGNPVFCGFKGVIFQEYVSAWSLAGISPKEYIGHEIRIRGVIKQHTKWGNEIIINSPRLIAVIKKEDSNGEE